MKKKILFFLLILGGAGALLLSSSDLAQAADVAGCYYRQGGPDDIQAAPQFSTKKDCEASGLADAAWKVPQNFCCCVAGMSGCTLVKDKIINLYKEISKEDYCLQQLPGIKKEELSYVSSQGVVTGEAAPLNANNECPLPPANYCVCKTKPASDPDKIFCTEKLYVRGGGGELLGIECKGNPAPGLQIGCQEVCDSYNADIVYCGDNITERDKIYNTSIKQAKGCAPMHCWCQNTAGYCTHDTEKPNGGSFYDRDSCTKFCDAKNVNGEVGWKSTHWEDKYTNYYKIPVSQDGCLYEIPRPKVSPYDFTGNLKLEAQSGLNPLTKFRGPQDFLGNAIRVILSLIGALVLVMYIYGGLLWMTAAGNSEQTGKAKQVLVWATLGVAVMLSSYVLVTFLFRDVLKLGI